jgi:PAS domain S-box-containing protein
MNVEPTSQRVILLVADDAVSAMACVERLRTCGFSVLTASSAEIAVTTMRDTSKVDLILMDVELGMAGVAAAERILQTYDIPLLFLLGDVSPDIVAATEKVASYGYVMKAGAEAVLLASIRTALRLHTAHRNVYTPEVQAELHLFRTIMEQSQEAVAVSDSSGRLLYINPAHERLFGRSLEEARQTNYRDYYPPESVMILNEEVAPVLAQGGSWEGELDVFDADGRHFPLWERAGSVRDAQGNMRYGFGFMHDITERKAVENALRESEYKFRMLFEQAPSPILIVDTQGFYIDANPAALEFLECDLVTLRRKRVWDFSPPNLLEQQQQEHTPFAQPRTLETAYWVNGQIKTLLLNVVPIHLADATILYGIGQDITERKRIETALKESHDLLAMTLSSLDEAVFVVNPHTRLILQCNVKTEAMFGYRREELVGQETGFLHVNAEKFAQFGCAALAAYETQGYYQAEFQMKRKNGEIFPTEHFVRPVYRQGQLDYVVSVVRDITQRKQVEAALRESEARWQFALEGAGDGVWDWNAQTNCVYFSPRWKSMLGFAAHEIDGALEEWDKRVHPDDRDYVYAELQQHFAGKTAVYVSEHRMQCKDGSYKWILDRGQVISRTADGQPLRVIGTHTDITERKHIEAALRESNAIKDTLLRELQHRVKNTLVMIKNLISLQAAYVEQEETRAALQLLEDRVGAIADLYMFLYHAKDIQAVDLDAYLARMMINLSAVAGNVTVEYQGTPVVQPVKTTVSLGLIVNELFTNALKYAFPDQQPGCIEVRLQNEADEVVLAVCDNGVGLPANFDPQQSGGLGLKLVNMLVWQHQGSLQITREDKTCFLVKIPKAA